MSGTAVCKTMIRGCPQRSACSPGFWVILYDDLLQQQLPENCTLNTYADDALLLVKSKTITHLQDTANEALARIHSWGKKNKLNFNASKTSAMLATRRRNIEPLTLEMDESNAQLVHEIKYLVHWNLYWTDD